MLKLFKSMMAGLMAVAVATPALAADPAAELPANTFLDKQAEEQYLAKDLLIGAKVLNDDGKIIGDIEDVVLNDWNRVMGVVMGTGGFLGMAEKKVGVQLGALKFEEQDGKTVVKLPGVTQAMLKEVPPFERKQPKKSLLQRAMEKARELTDKTTETSKELYEKAKDQAGPAYEKAKEAASQAYEKTKEAAGSAYEKAKDAAGQAVDRAKEAAQPSDAPAGQ